MKSETEEVSYVEAGYQTLEGEIEVRREARERFRRRCLCGIRGWLRERKLTRWWIAAFLLGCVTLALMLVNTPVTSICGKIWKPLVAILLTWPLYLAALYILARYHCNQIKLAGRWEHCVGKDEMGEVRDRQVSATISKGVNKAWESMSRSQRQSLAVSFALAIVTLGTWLVWDMLRTGPDLIAQIMLDGVIAPAHPKIADRLPNQKWYESAVPMTGFYFFSAGVLAEMADVLVFYVQLYQAVGS